MNKFSICLLINSTDTLYPKEISHIFCINAASSFRIFLIIISLHKFQFVKLNKIEFEEVVRGRKEVAEKDYTEVGLAEKPKATVRTEVRELRA